MNRRALAAATALMAPLVFLASLYIPFSGDLLNPEPVVSLRILDRNGVLLREVLSDEGGRCSWVSLDEISPLLLKAAVAAEDRSFYLHPGVNILSVLRALSQNVTHRRIVSGASTISQQLVRNLYHSRRTLFAKIIEAWHALRLEKKLSKDEILIQYINRISYGNQAYGIEAASRLYFDKPARELSLAEAAFLAGLPRAPSTLNPFRSATGAVARQHTILQQMFRHGDIEKEAYERALKQPLLISSARDKFRAPHFCDHILGKISPKQKSRINSIITTLDASIQAKVEILTLNHLAALESKNITNASVVILDNRTDAVLAMVGSKNFFDDSIDGQVNGAEALRQPGSALKPFTYGLALENGKTAASLIDDRQMDFSTPTGSYSPRNYDRTYHGPVRLRTALACSYNVPAVYLLQAMGPDLLYRRLKKSGFESLSEPPGYYGVGLTLGNAEVTLMELVQAYAALARGGIFRTSRVIESVFPDNSMTLEAPLPYRIYSREVAYLLTHILSDNDARIPAFGYNSPLHLPFPCAAKTGTTKDYRDNWTIGWTKNFTVGVWVGNFNGDPMHNVSGISGCGPLFHDVMGFLEREDPSGEFDFPDSLIRTAICPESGLLASESCPGRMEEIFIRGTLPEDLCTLHRADQQGESSLPAARKIQPGNPPPLRILFPVDGDIFKIDPVLRRDYQTLRFRASVPAEMDITAVEWWINEKRIAEIQIPFELSWKIKPGKFRIKIRCKKGSEILESPAVHFSVLL